MRGHTGRDLCIVKPWLCCFLERVGGAENGGCGCMAWPVQCAASFG